jgi:arylsulfatase
MTRPPNILFVMADQWRGDCLGSAGHPVVETPHLDEMFFHGVRFSHAYSAVPTCIAARAAVMTGLSQRSHGRVGYADNIPWDYPITLPRLFTDAGYHTQCVGKMHVSPERSLLGFHNVVLHDGQLHKHRTDENHDFYDDYRRFLRSHTHADAELQETGIHVNSWAVNLWPYEERFHPTNWAASEAIDFLRRRDPRKPFFLNVSFVRPHPPFDPPQKYFDFYRDKALPPVPMGPWSDRFVKPGGGLNTRWTRGEIAPAALDRARRAYYALITQIDFQISRLLMALQEQGLDENTVILFVSDHGEMLGDHNFHAKAMPFDGSSRVPWLMKFPGSWRLGGRQVIDAPVELRDILPTLCDCAGIPVPASVEGRSVMDLLRGKGEGWRKYLHGEHVRDELESNHWLTDTMEKYVWFSQTGHELLFDLRSDPQELNDLASAQPERLSFWRERLVRELKGREEGFVHDDKLVPGRRLQNSLKQSQLGMSSLV